MDTLHIAQRLHTLLACTPAHCRREANYQKHMEQRNLENRQLRNQLEGEETEKQFAMDEVRNKTLASRKGLHDTCSISSSVMITCIYPPPASALPP